MFGWHMGQGPGMGWGWGLWGLGHLLWWLLLAAFVVVLWRLVSQRRDGGPPPEDSALKLLRERYARGEINLEEFEERRRNLQR
ncbi:MAG TPA: SHOCT domain-containing protein [Burkholderiaceae bacterium]|nr:SHOCT domain-containing protein [Burkholderiaceae bacterium]